MENLTRHCQALSFIVGAFTILVDPSFLEMGILLSLEGFQVDTLCCSTVASWNISLKDKSDVIDELLVILPHVQF